MIFVHDAGGKQIAEYSTIVAPQTQAKVAYLTNDHLGSPRINTDQSGAVISRHDYHPFGEEISTTQRSNHPEYAGDSVRKQFTGYERDKETELDFAQARYYAKDLGRFSTTDPLSESAKPGSPQSWNRYIYVYNNPGRFTDKTGRMVDWVQKDGEVFFDSRVTDQASASSLYGEQAIYRPNGDKYTASDGSNIELMGDGIFFENGTKQYNGDRAVPVVPGSVVPQMAEEMSRTDGDRHTTLQVGAGPITVIENINTTDGKPVGPHFNGVGLGLSFPDVSASYTNFRGHAESGVYLNGQVCVAGCLSLQTNIFKPIQSFSVEPGLGTPQAGVGINAVWKDNPNRFRPESFDPITQQQLLRPHPGYRR